MLEMMVVQTLCGAAMVLVGACAAHGFPKNIRKADQPQTLLQNQPDDAFAEDLAAMLGYTAENTDGTANGEDVKER